MNDVTPGESNAAPLGVLASLEGLPPWDTRKPISGAAVLLKAPSAPRSRSRTQLTQKGLEALVRSEVEKQVADVERRMKARATKEALRQMMVEPRRARADADRDRVARSRFRPSRRPSRASSRRGRSESHRSAGSSRQCRSSSSSDDPGEDDPARGRGLVPNLALGDSAGSEGEHGCRLEGVQQHADECGPLVSFADLHDWTPGLTGPERLAVFETLRPQTREAMSASLKASLERDRR